MCNITRRKWRVLCWNVRGLNGDNRQREVHSKIEESDCDIICLQETKCEVFDWRLIKKFCTRNFDRFAYSPSAGASGGIIVLWKSSIFEGILVEVHSFAVVVKFTSVHDNSSWHLVSVYGPCGGPERDVFCFLAFQFANSAV
jgi:exonuclease III